MPLCVLSALLLLLLIRKRRRERPEVIIVSSGIQPSHTRTLYMYIQEEWSPGVLSKESSEFTGHHTYIYIYIYTYVSLDAALAVQPSISTRKCRPVRSRARFAVIATAAHASSSRFLSLPTISETLTITFPFFPLPFFRQWKTV